MAAAPSNCAALLLLAVPPLFTIRAAAAVVVVVVLREAGARDSPCRRRIDGTTGGPRPKATLLLVAVAALPGRVTAADAVTGVLTIGAEAIGRARGPLLVSMKPARKTLTTNRSSQTSNDPPRGLRINELSSCSDFSYEEARVSTMKSGVVAALFLAMCSLTEGFLAQRGTRRQQSHTSLKMLFDGPLGTPEYGVLFLATVVPSLAFVKFVGDASDRSRGTLSSETQEKFRKSMMEQPGANLALPTSEEEALKKAIANAYRQDKDVDVAVLEEKLRKRAQWRKEMMAEQKKGSQAVSVDEDGW